MAHRQYLFFDLGWTIEDETEAQVDRARKSCMALRGLGIDASPDEFLRRQEDGARRFEPSVYRYALRSYGLSESQVCEVLEYAGWDKRLLRLYDDAVVVLEELARDHFLAIIANQSPGTEERLERYGIRGLFNLVFASAELGLSKPDSEVFRRAREAAGCPAGEAWMIGDRIDNDVRPARALGWHTVRIMHGYNRMQVPGGEGDSPDHTVSTLNEIPALVNRTA